MDKGKLAKLRLIYKDYSSVIERMQDFGYNTVAEEIKLDQINRLIKLMEKKIEDEKKKEE